MKRNIAVVVTFNRLELLKECILAIQNQSLKADAIVVINNNSTDGTTEWLNKITSPELIVVNCKENLGGAGGFTLGITTALPISQGGTLWIMDDDCIPDTTALEELVLVARKHPNFGFLCSEVRNNAGEVMNVPAPASNWSSNLDSHIVAVNRGTFVSILFNADTIKNVGLPISEFFIWYDDSEFTYRISSYGPSYLVWNSKVIHKTKGSKKVSIRTDDDRIPRYYYYYRNGLFYYRESKGKLGCAFFVSVAIADMFSVLANSKFKLKKIRVIMKGTISGMFFHPQIKFPKHINKIS